MTLHFKLNSIDKLYKIGKDETILQAALRYGLVLPYGCKNGACGSCKAFLRCGQVDYGTHHPKALSEFEKENKKLLLCTAKPLTDVEIEAALVSSSETNLPKKLPCRVEAIEKKSLDIAIVKLKLPSSEKFNFNPGQYVDILLKDGKRRSYSMANTPNQNNILEFHIKHTPGGAFTDAIFGDGANSINMIKEKDILRLEGPLGTFFLRNSKKPIIFLASGTGFAPIKAISESIFSRGVDRKIVLFWGVRKPEDLYMNEKIIGWTKQFSNFEYIPVISEDVPENLWSGKRGFVHHVAMSMYPDMRNYSVYSCGAPIVVQSAQRDFISQCNLPENEFFSDAFTTAADNLENKK